MGKSASSRYVVVEIPDAVRRRKTKARAAIAIVLTAVTFLAIAYGQHESGSANWIEYMIPVVLGALLGLGTYGTWKTTHTRELSEQAKADDAARAAEIDKKTAEIFWKRYVRYPCGVLVLWSGYWFATNPYAATRPHWFIYTVVGALVLFGIVCMWELALIVLAGALLYYTYHILVTASPTGKIVMAIIIGSIIIAGAIRSQKK